MKERGQFTIEREEKIIEAARLIMSFLDDDEVDGRVSEALENQLCALEDKLKW